MELRERRLGAGRRRRARPARGSRIAFCVDHSAPSGRSRGLARRDLSPRSRCAAGRGRRSAPRLRACAAASSSSRRLTSSSACSARRSAARHRTASVRRRRSAASASAIRVGQPIALDGLSGLRLARVADVDGRRRIDALCGPASAMRRRLRALERFVAAPSRPLAADRTPRRQTTATRSGRARATGSVTTLRGLGLALRGDGGHRLRDLVRVAEIAAADRLQVVVEFVDQRSRRSAR